MGLTHRHAGLSDQNANQNSPEIATATHILKSAGPEVLEHWIVGQHHMS